MRRVLRFGRVCPGLLAVVLIAGASMLLAGSAAAVTPPDGCVTASGTTTCTFAYTGAEQSFTVPTGVTAVTLDVFGAQGGNGSTYGTGGSGGEATAVVTVSPGATLTVVVGGQGGVGGGTTGGSGGFGGGGSAGSTTALAPGSGGGGASLVRDGSTVLAIGGGGGGATPWVSTGNGNGGSGGGLIGTAGNTPLDPSHGSSGPAGAPGTQLAGGVGSGGGGSGGAGQGGTGADFPGGGWTCGGSGAGGGGGYFGGAGGAACAGGGGGSGFVTAAATSSSFQTGVRTGNGVVTISFTPPDSTPPTTTIALSPAAASGSNGWYTGLVGVSVGATDNAGGSGVAETRCVLDPVSVPVSFAALPATPCPYLGGGANASSDGTHTVYAASIDNQGNAESPVVTSSFKIDKTKPTISAAATTSPNGAGWYNTNVTVHFTCADALSNIPANTCPADQVLTGEGAAVSSTAQTVTDAAGNTSDPSNVVTVKIDKTKPTISAAATTSPNGAGWYNTNVTIHFTCADALSNIPANTCPADQVLTGEGAAVSSTAQTVTDAAGNTSDPSNVVTVKIDKTKPTISAAATTSPNGAGWYNTNVTIHFTCADVLSGIPAGTCPADQLLSSEGAAVPYTAKSVTDNAGNVSDLSTAFTVKIDKTPPIVTIVSISPNPTGGSTTVTWHANENGSYSIVVGGTNCATGTPAATGTYSSSASDVATVVPGASLAVGVNTLRVCVTDAASNSGSTTGTVTRAPDQCAGMAFDKVVFMTSPSYTSFSNNRQLIFAPATGNTSISLALAHDNCIVAGAGSLSATVNSGNNVLVGGPGRDVLTGGSGSDTLIGGGAPSGQKDTLSGGGGTDTCVGDAASTVKVACEK